MNDLLFKKLEDKSSLSFSHSEKRGAMLRDLNRVFHWIEQLGGVDTTNREPCFTVINEYYRCTDDIAGGLKIDNNNLTDYKGQFFLVPKVIK